MKIRIEQVKAPRPQPGQPNATATSRKSGVVAPPRPIFVMT